MIMLLSYKTKTQSVIGPTRQARNLGKPNRERVGASWLPDPPLIVAAWSETTDAAKRIRFEYHLDWAWNHRTNEKAFNAVIELLSNMKPEDWHTER
jgi:hypothetical protein